MSTTNVITKRSFGPALRQEFQFAQDWRNMNHGSYGATPKPVRDALRSFQDESENSADKFLEFSFHDYLNESRAAVAPVLNAPAETLVFMQNVTTGVNVVLRNLVFEPGDHIVYFATIYGACEKTILHVSETTAAQATKIQYSYPVSDDYLVQALKDTVAGIKRNGDQAKVVIFDTIASNPGVRMPFERLTQVCKDLQVLSLIDGAHGIGHVELNLSELNPDFFVTTCHKWLYVPRSCAVFYVPVRNQQLLRTTLPTSHGFLPRQSSGSAIVNPHPISKAKSQWQANFDVFGTIDVSPYLTIPAAIKFRESLGGETAIRDYCFRLARDGGARVAAILGTEVLENAEGSLGECCLTNVRLPLDFAVLQERARDRAEPDSELAAAASSPAALAAVVRGWMLKSLVDEFRTWIPPVFHAGVMWARLSAQAYLDMGDFEWAGQVLKRLCERAMKGEAFEVQSDNREQANRERRVL